MLNFVPRVSGKIKLNFFIQVIPEKRRANMIKNCRVKDIFNIVLVMKR